MVIRFLHLAGGARQYELIEDLITSVRKGKFNGVTASTQHYATAIRALGQGVKDIDRGRTLYDKISTKPEIGLDKFVLSAILDLYGADQFTDAKKIWSLAVKNKKVSAMK